MENKREDVIVKGLLPYFIDVKNRSIVEGACLYNSPGKRHCFVGQFLKTKYKRQGLKFGHNTKDYGSLRGMRVDYLNKEIKLLEDDLIDRLQQYHDSEEPWESRKESWRELQFICNKYYLDFKYIKSRLLHGVREYKKNISFTK